MAEEDRRTHAEESIAPRFTRAMRATVSPYGMYTDPPIVALLTAITVTAALALRLQAPGELPVAALVVLAVLPILAAVGLGLALLGARAQVVDWLTSLPFPVENVNGLLHGVADHLQVRFRESRPDRSELNDALEGIDEECFVLEFEGETDLEVQLKIGVLDSKWNPSRAAHRRFRRVQAMVEQVLVPLHEQHPIDDVWVS